MMTPLLDDEVRLEGKWEPVDGKVEADATARRIDDLITSELTRLSVSSDGWDVLFRDDRDGRFWELTQRGWFATTKEARITIRRYARKRRAS